GCEVISFPVFFLYAWKAEVKMEWRLKREVLAAGTADITARKNGDEGISGWWEGRRYGAANCLPYMDSFVPTRFDALFLHSLQRLLDDIDMSDLPTFFNWNSGSITLPSRASPKHRLPSLVGSSTPSPMPFKWSRGVWPCAMPLSKKALDRPRVITSLPARRRSLKGCSWTLGWTVRSWLLPASLCALDVPGLPQSRAGHVPPSVLPFFPAGHHRVAL
ncbi:hypothetical protein BC826DRAFT_1058654, partial [Russula brevipes]